MVGRRKWLPFLCWESFGRFWGEKSRAVSFRISGRAVSGESVTSALQAPNVFNEWETET